MTTPAPDVTPFRITVVCLGNICRSPIGEVVLRDRIAAAGLADQVVVDSAGTGDWHIGQGADPRTLAVLDAHGYEHAHTARQITPNWFADIDLVLAMDESNYANLERLIARSGQETELRMMRSFDPGLAHLSEPHPDLDVPDPYYGGPDGFVEVLRMIERASDGLVADLRHQRG
jgi:protein-tyrosine phosphatase